MISNYCMWAFLHQSMRSRMMLCILVGISLCLSSAANGEQFNQAQIAGVKTLTIERTSRIHNAIRVGNKYLAAVEVWTDSSRRIAPAWFSSEWQMLSIGSGIEASRAVMNPIPSDTEEQPDPIVFPQVLVRNPADAKCPYIYGIVSEFYCFDHTLELGERYELPAQARGYKVVRGEVWFAGVYDGQLFHRVNLGTKKVDRSVVKIAEVVQHLRNQHLDEDSFKDILKAQESTPVALDANATPAPDVATQDTQKEQVRLLFRLKKLGKPFQFAVEVNDSRGMAYLLLRRPLSIVMLSWPAGKVLDVTQIQRNELPEWAHIYQQLYVNGMFTINKEPAAWVSIDRGITYGELDPASAARIKESLASENPPQEVTVNTIVGIETEHLLMQLKNARVARVTWFFKGLRDTEWKPIAAPIFMNDKAWLHVEAHDAEGPLDKTAMVALKY